MLIGSLIDMGFWMCVYTYDAHVACLACRDNISLKDMLFYVGDMLLNVTRYTSVMAAVL